LFVDPDPTLLEYTGAHTWSASSPTTRGVWTNDLDYKLRGIWAPLCGTIATPQHVGAAPQNLAGALTHRHQFQPATALSVIAQSGLLDKQAHDSGNVHCPLVEKYLRSVENSKSTVRVLTMPLRNDTLASVYAYHKVDLHPVHRKLHETGRPPQIRHRRHL
jgi:hypothetical protein